MLFVVVSFSSYHCNSRDLCNITVLLLYCYYNHYMLVLATPKSLPKLSLQFSFLCHSA